MTDSMKFGPEWLRNMSAEPSVVSINNVSAVGCVGVGGAAFHSGGVGGGGNILAGPTSHNIAAAASRNMFPEYRYGREEMLSLFERNCLLPQILPSFKKLFVEKVQFPLALTPSSEEEMNSQTQLGSTSRPAWLQRSAGGFGIPLRGSGRGGTVERGRMRGKSVYHPIYQRPNAIYDDNSLSAISMKPERNWTERNGTGDSTAVGVGAAAGTGSGSGSGSSAVGMGLDWNGTPSSSPRKEFSSHNRNLENWRRNRNEDGSGDGPAPGSVGAGTDAAGWRSGSTHRWGRSTSWRDEEPIHIGNLDGNSFGGNAVGNIQRSISAIGTVGIERAGIKAPGSGLGIGPPGATRQMSSKWPGNASGVDGNLDDNLPEWAMENPSEMGGTFDSSGAFHGESTEHNATPRKQQTADSDLKDVPKEKLVVALNNTSSCPPLANVADASTTTSTSVPVSASINSASLDQETKLPKINVETNANKNKDSHSNAQTDSIRSNRMTESTSTPTHKIQAIHGDISERFKEVANEVEKLIMDDENRVDGILTELPNTTNRYQVMPNQGLPNSLVEHQLMETPASVLPFSDQLAMQQQHHQHHLQQQQSLSVLPPHMINANPNDLWYYRDPQSNVQGPFCAMEMTEWYRAGYFNEILFVRRFSDSRFRPLGELIKLCHGNMPFTHSHLLPTPMDLDNLQIGLAPRKVLPLPIPLSLNEQQHRPGVILDVLDDQLKVNVTAVADSLSAAVKGHMSAHSGHVDMSHMLTMRFQMLQDQYLQHQEYQILSDLSKHEGFQRLDAVQRESIVRSKVQMLVLPEYLSSFSGLSNSLAALNPISGSHLYDVIVQQAKKDQQHQQHHQIFPGSTDANDFIINAQLMHQQAQRQVQVHGQTQPEKVQQFNSNSNPDTETSKLNELPSTDLDLLNEYNLRMLLRGPSSANQQQQVKPNSGVDFMTELAAQNLMMPIWPHNMQQHQQQSTNNQPWPGMPNAKVTLWDVATLEEQRSQQLLLQQQQQKLHLSAPINTNLDFDTVSQQNNNQDNQRNPEEESISTLLQPQNQHQHLQQTQLDQGIPSIVDSVTSQRKDQQSVQLQFQMQLQLQQAAVAKLAIKPQQQLGHKQQQQSQGKQPEPKPLSEEERRREQAEEKKRLKEERKRQQQDEEKRRALQADEEKNRQLQEEKERQQQIQAQRRRALLGNPQSAAAPTPAICATSAGTKVSGVKIEQQAGGPGAGRSHGTSVAPWSLQAPSVSIAAQGLAEIQKAERRERRADQQRQQEQLDKQLRATAAAAAEANDALLKWQAAPAPAAVMSLLDIQAEEAKRLANELVEQQRRREHEQQQQATLASSLTVSGALSNIWGSANKAWSGSAINSGPATAVPCLWEDLTPAAVAPPKYVTQLLGNSTTATAASVLAAGLPTTNTNKQPSQSQVQPQVQAKSAAILPSPRNLRKSQTLPAMQNLLLKNAKTASGQQQQQQGQQQQQQDKNKMGPSKATSKATGSEDKKLSVKNQQQSIGGGGGGGADVSSNSKISEYENDFTIWCMKTLDNMSAKVDVPTFVAFLQDLEAPYEVKDYVRIYLGEGKESTDFAKQFLERRSKYKSMQRAQNAHNDDMCKPAPAITPSSNDNGDNKNKQKKVKKNKMTKMDARILGFSVTAAEGRINVGGRDYVDGP